MSRISGVVAGGLGIALIGAGYLDVQAARPQAASPSAPSQQAADPTAARPASPAPIGVSSRALLDKYCVTCHNDKRKTAGLMLDKMDVEHVGSDAEVWEK